MVENPVAATAKLEPVTFELLRNSLGTILDEMSLTMIRTSHSTSVRDGMDFAVALCDAEGQLALQGLSIPIHLGSMPMAMRSVLDKFEGTIKPGDVFALNDPFAGGAHLADIYLFAPVFAEEELLCFLCVVSDHVDIGGRFAGGRGISSTEIFEEGIRIPPVRFVDGGRRTDAQDVLASNVRIPDTVMGDIQSGLAAFFAASRLIQEVVDRFGKDIFQSFLAEVITYSERMAESVISSLPLGVFEFTDYVEGAVGFENPTGDDALEIHIRLHSEGNKLVLDFSESAPAVRSALNCPLATTRSAAYAAVRTIMPAELIANEGLFRTLEVITVPGTVVHAVHPSAVASRGAVALRVVDTTLGALAQLVPAGVPASGEGGNFSGRITGRSPNGESWILWEALSGTWGGRPDRDGIDGCANFAVNLATVPIEVIEAEFPVRMVRYGLRSDSGGAGRFRGGLGLDREWEILAYNVTMVGRSERVKFAPWSLDGGQPGQRAQNILNPDAAEREVLPAKFERAMRYGDRVRHSQASGAGYGDPFQRDPDRVLEDWLDDKVSVESARELYGVVIDTASSTIDAAATRALRDA